MHINAYRAAKNIGQLIKLYGEIFESVTGSKDFQAVVQLTRMAISVYVTRNLTVFPFMVCFRGQGSHPHFLPATDNHQLEPQQEKQIKL